ncbi:MAG: 2-oxoacid:acceptor oxidoreductase family protein [Oscillospiraceae bacterium]|nr:2-oxoacid:acceptor oxidoreductase family protein [Oscillospiraceae bacterium]
MILSFEAIEAARYLEYLKPEGALITSTQEIDPMPVITGAVAYPKDILEQVAAIGVKAVSVDALSLAVEAGSPKAANVVMIGAASVALGGTEEEWMEVLAACVPPKFLEMNRKAFMLGRETALAR